MMDDINLNDVLKIVRETLKDVHIETGRADAFDKVCNDVSSAVYDSMKGVPVTATVYGHLITGNVTGSFVDIFESDRLLYKDCEFRNVKIVFRDRIYSHPLQGCLLRDCEVISEQGDSKSQVLVGYNIMLGGTFNGEAVEDFRTNGGRDGS